MMVEEIRTSALKVPRNSAESLIVTRGPFVTRVVYSKSGQSRPQLKGVQSPPQQRNHRGGSPATWMTGTRADSAKACLEGAWRGGQARLPQKNESGDLGSCDISPRHFGYLDPLSQPPLSQSQLQPYIWREKETYEG